MKNLTLTSTIEKGIGLAIGFSSYSNKRELNLLFLCFTFNICWKVKVKDNLFTPKSFHKDLRRLKHSLILLTFISTLNLTMIVITELSNQIPDMLNVIWGMLMTLLIVFYVIDIKAYKRLRRSIVKA